MIESKNSNNTEKIREKRQEAVFFQLAGHRECFKIGLKPKTILKKATGNEELCLKELMQDKLAPFVPKVYGIMKIDDVYYLELEDLLANFENSCSKNNNTEDDDRINNDDDDESNNNNNNKFLETCVMDIKMGCRTCRSEDGLCDRSGKQKLRPDMYDRMIEVDINEPTDEENMFKGVTKQRYMIWRDNVTSSASLGFRIEGMRFSDGIVDKAFQTTKTEEQVAKAFLEYAKSLKIRIKYLNRLYVLKKTLLQSKFFYTHELIGSSLLFVHSNCEANIWIIDFAKTNLVPKDFKVTHTKRWENENYEDGYLIGIDNLIKIFESISKTPATNSNTQIIDQNKLLSNEQQYRDTFLKDSTKQTILLYRTTKV